MIVLKRIGGDDCQIVSSLDGIDATVWAQTGEAVPDDLEAHAYTLVGDQLTAVPRTLTPEGVVALYTPEEKARIFTSTEPNVQALLNALRFSIGIVVGSDFHVQGTALIAGLGLLDAPERAVRILAGETPE